MIKKKRERRKETAEARVEEFDCLHDIPNLHLHNSRGIPQVMKYHAKQRKTLLLAMV